MHRTAQQGFYTGISAWIINTLDPIHQNDLLVSNFYSYSSYSINLAVHCTQFLHVNVTHKKIFAYLIVLPVQTQNECFS